MLRSQTCLCMVLLIALCSCSRGLQSQIIGRWELPTGAYSLQFFPDGTVVKTNHMTVPPSSVTGTYRFVDPEHFRVEYSGLGVVVGAAVYKAEIEGDEMTLWPTDGGMELFQRIK